MALSSEARKHVAKLYNEEVMRKHGIVETGTSIPGLPPSVKQTPKAMIGAKDVVKTRVGRIPQAELEKMSVKEVRAAVLAGKAEWSDFRAAKDRSNKAFWKSQNDDAEMRRDRALVAESGNLDAFDALGPSIYEARALRRRKDQDRAMQQESFGLNLPAKEWKTQKDYGKSAEQINAAGAAVANAATSSSPTIINASTSNVSSNKTDITSTSKSLVNPNPIVEKLNAM